MATKAKAPKRSSRSRRRVYASKRTEPIKDSDRELLGIPTSEWAAAKRKERIVRGADERRVGGRLRRLFGANDSPFGRDLSNGAIATRIPAAAPGPKPGSQRLEFEQESIVAKAVERWKASAEPLPVERAVEDVRRLAKAAGVRPVARNTVALRLWGHGGKSTRQCSPKVRIPSDIPRMRRALGMAQVDHTPIDLIVVEAIRAMGAAAASLGSVRVVRLRRTAARHAQRRRAARRSPSSPLHPRSEGSRDPEDRDQAGRRGDWLRR